MTTATGPVFRRGRIATATGDPRCVYCGAATGAVGRLACRRHRDLLRIDPYLPRERSAA